jgi:hypothetical protein
MSSRIPKVIADLELQIASPIGVGDTSFTLNASTDDDGVAIPAGIYCFTVDNGTSQKEYLIGQVNGTAVTSVKSVSRQGVETTGASRKHRIGAPCILTDFAAVQRVVDILKGINTLDSASPISYEAEPTLSDRKQVATVGYVLDAAFGGDITFDSQVITNVTAGEDIALGDLIYFKTSDQEWYLVDADDADTVNGVQLGIAKGVGEDGVAITGGVQLSGVFTTTGLTAGATYYVSNTAGEISDTAGTIKQVVGVALSSTRILLTLPNPQTVSSREKDALSGGGDLGTPSGANKFQTKKGVASIGAFGDGSDGDVTISTGTTITRDMYYNDLIVNDTLITNGYRVFVAGTLSGTGTIKAADGNNGTNGANAFTTNGSDYLDGADGVGGASVGSGWFPNRAGTNGAVNPVADVGGIGNPGGQAGAGGGKSTPPAPSNQTHIPFVEEFNYGLGISPVWGLDIQSNGTLGYYKATAGGQGGSRGIKQSQGGGGTTGATGGAGGGGASGGLVWISARNWGGSFTLRAIGGNGGNAGTSFNGYYIIGESSGGAGGAGGTVVVFYGTKTWTGSYNLSGGTAGAKGGGTFDSGYGAAASNNGPTGVSFEIEL